MMSNLDLPYDQFWVIFGLVAWGLSTGTGILFLGPESKRLNNAAAEHGPKSPEAQAGCAGSCSSPASTSR